MIASEIREVIYVALSLIIAAAILTFVALGITERNNLAEYLTDREILKYTSSLRDEFSRYNDNILYGEEVLEVVRKYSGSNILVVVDDLFLESSTGTSRIHKLFMENCSAVTKSKYHVQMSDANCLYLSSKDAFNANDIGKAESDILKVLPTETYYCYLVWGEYNEDNIVSARYQKGKEPDYTEITGIIIKHIGEGKHIYVRDYDKKNHDICAMQCGCYHREMSANTTISKVQAMEKCKSYQYSGFIANEQYPKNT